MYILPIFFLYEYSVNYNKKNTSTNKIFIVFKTNITSSKLEQLFYLKYNSVINAIVIISKCMYELIFIIDFIFIYRIFVSETLFIVII